MSQPADHKSTLKRAWSGSRDQFLPRDATGIVSIRLHTGSRKQRQTVAQGLCHQKYFRNSNEVTPNGGDKCRWGGVKSANFYQWTISSSDALPPQMCIHPPGRRCYCYQQHPLEVTYDDNVCNANDVGLKAHSHCGDINEVSRQFIAVPVCQYNSLQSRGCEWTLM